jgi:hypothetical protein
MGQQEEICKYRKSFHCMMTAVMQGIGRAANTREFKIQKFLECSHFLKDHIRFGPSVGHNTDTGERGLKQWAKRVAKTAQKRGDPTFRGQVAQNIQEMEILQLLANLEEQPGAGNRGTACGQAGEDKQAADGVGVGVGVVPEPIELTTFGRNFVIVIDETRTDVYPIRGKGSVGRIPATNLFPKEVVSWFDSMFRPLWVGHREPDSHLRIQLVTEIRLPDPETKKCVHIVRAHPEYMDGGCWYDYVEVDYGDSGLFPARCAAFFEWPKELPLPGNNQGFQEITDSKELLGVFHECKYQSPAEKEKNSLLFSTWTLEEKRPRAPTAACGQIQDYLPKVIAKFKCLNARTINRRIFAIDPTPGDGGPFHRLQANKFVVVKVEDRQLEWPSRFLDSYAWWEGKWEDSRRDRRSY